MFRVKNIDLQRDILKEIKNIKIFKSIEPCTTHSKYN